MSRTKKIVIAAGAVVLVGFVIAGWQGARAWMAWNGIDRVEFDLEEARAVLPRPQLDTQESSTLAPTVVAVEYETVLVIGTDGRPEDESNPQEQAFADAVMLYMLPDDGSGPLIVSLPRDLIVVNPCDGEETKLDRTLEGCGAEIGGEELVALAVEDFTGVGVDNFVSFRFEAFVEMVDAVDGVEICSPYALREGTLDLVPEGCSIVEGAQALAWLRSRRTQELVDGVWRFADQAGDQARVARQQTLIFALLAQLKTIRSPADLAGLAQEVGDTVVLDDTLGIADAVAMVWDLRSLTGGGLRTLTVATEPTVLDDGSFAVRATETFAETLSR